MAHLPFLPEGLPSAHGLYDPANEHDACGIGLLANINNVKSHRIVKNFSCREVLVESNPRTKRSKNGHRNLQLRPACNLVLAVSLCCCNRAPIAPLARFVCRDNVLSRACSSQVLCCTATGTTPRTNGTKPVICAASHGAFA